MLRHLIPFLLILTLFNSCQTQDKEAIIAFKVYCEMVANEAKPIAFHYPMERKVIASLWNDFERVALEYQVFLYREKSLPESLLFSANATEGKEVIVIYKGNRIEQYLQWKNDVTQYQGDDFEVLEANARRLGRLLGYSPKGINSLLRKNSDYRDLASFEVKEQITHLYYENIMEATNFYQNVLGLPQIDSSKFQISNAGYLKLHPFDDNHTKEQSKSTAIALLTNELPAWYAYAQKQEIPIKYTYKPRKGGPHDGFVAIDPGGYLLEFEQFKQHPENEFFIAILSKAPRITTTIQNLNFYGTITWTYHKDMLKMQQFYEEVLGYEIVADQGWTKIYQTAPSAFIGLVDERRGMEDFAENKAIEIEWKISDEPSFLTYSKKFWQLDVGDNKNHIGPENYIYRIEELNP